VYRQRRRQARAQGFLGAQEGGITIFGLFIFATMAIIGGIALDVSHLYAARTQLQVTADTVAHAALFRREQLNPEDAKQAAIDLVEAGMPAGTFGEVVTPADIAFGRYDFATRTFTSDDTSREAVHVSTARLGTRGNAAAAFLFRMLGFREFDISARAVYVTYRPMCFREGFVANGVVDMQSNNGFSNGFCIHSNTHVAVNQNNIFEPGTIVSMPDTDDLVLPNSGFEKNEGLQAALRNGAYHLRVLDDLSPADPDEPSLIERITLPGMDLVPDYITSSTVIYPPVKFTEADIKPGHVHVMTCGGGGINFGKYTMSNVVIVTDCNVSFNDTALEDAVVITTNTSFKSVTGSANFRLGRQDDCLPGGGAQILTLGGMDFASGVALFGSQMIAMGDIKFAANADGIKGASMVAGGRIDGTSNMRMAFCGSGMENNFEAEYFRLAA